MTGGEQGGYWYHCGGTALCGTLIGGRQLCMALMLFHIYNLYSLSFYLDCMIILVFLTLKVKARTQFNILEINHKEKKKIIGYKQPKFLKVKVNTKES